MRSRLRSALAPLVAAAVLAFAGASHAQSAAELEAARQLFADGTALEKKKDYAAALEKFRKVAAIKSTAIVRYHEGFCAEKLGRWIEALDAYAKAQVEGAGDAKQKDAVEAAKKAADALRPRVPRIRVKVTGTQKGKYELKIDGAPVSAALIDTAIPVDVGKHLVELSGEGIAADSQEVTVAEKELKEIAFEAREAGSAAPPPKETPKEPPPPKETPKEPPPPKDPPKGPPPKIDPGTQSGASSLGLVFGLWIGHVTPGGRIADPETVNLPRFAREGSSDQLDYYGAGVAVEPQIGFRFLKPLAVHAFFQRAFLTKSGHSRDSNEFSGTSDSYGLALSFVTHPEGTFGGYAEIAVAMRRTTYDAKSLGEKATFSGLDPIRLKLGASFKPMPDFTVLGFVWGALGTYSRFTYEDVNDANKSRDEAIDRTATHTFFGVGLGAAYDLSFAR